jgi:hypothetical protein
MIPRSTVVLVFAALVSLPRAGIGQGDSETAAPPDSVHQALGPRYAGSFFRSFFLGREYRDLWATPVSIPVLDLASFGGGLTPVSRGGGQQTTSLRLQSADGREFYFRSIDKDPSPNLPPELRGTIAAAVVQDQTSSAFPTAPLIVAALLDAAHVLHGEPYLFILPDDQRLGEFRRDFAGLVGMLEPRVAAPAPGDSVWGGASEIIGGDELFERVSRSPDDQVDIAALLRARLMDMLVGDWDRHRDQWSWVRFGDQTPRRWQPVPRDRDFAMVSYDGALLYVGRTTFPQLITFRSKYPSVLGLTWNGRELDRHFLMQLPPEEWQTITLELKDAITDEVIDSAVRRIPPEHFALNGERTIQILKARRDDLPGIARRFYEMLAGQAEIHATGADELATLVARDDSILDLSVSVRSATGELQPAYLHRTLTRHETREFRLFMGGGNDSVIISGPLHGMKVRVVGDSGVDALVDSAGVHWARMYDEDDGTSVSRGIHLDRRPHIPPPKRTPTEIPARDWGSRWTPSTTVVLGAPDVGFFLGGGRTLTVYGFRKYPYASRHAFHFGIATGPWTYRAEYHGEWRKESSRSYAQVFVRASGIEVLSFNGFGNELVIPPRGGQYYRVTQDQYEIRPSMVFALADHLSIDVGPLARLVRTDANRGRFIAALDPYGTGDFGSVGARAEFTFDTRDRPIAASHGALITVAGTVYPGWWDVRRAYTRLAAEASTYLTARKLPLHPTLALRAGGRKLFGPYPYFDAASIGGVGTVRLGRQNRFAGDAAVYGNSELRLTLARQVLGSSFDVGVFGLADVGRVFLEGEHSEKWHPAAGGGAWFSLLQPVNTVSIAWARSDQRTAFYLMLGFGI